MRRHAKAIVAISAMLLTLALGVTFAGAVPPVLTIGPASSVSYTSAHLSGTVDTEDEQAYYYFQYSKVGSGNWSTGAFQGPIPAGSGPESVSDDLTGLKAGTEYEVRLGTAVDGYGTNTQYSPEPNPTFTTDSVDVPTVSIDPVSSITEDGAHFSGTINPNASGTDPAFDVNWHFECTPACPGAGSGSIAADAVSHIVSGDATGLDPNTDYEARLVAENAGPPVVDATNFTTSAPPPVIKLLPPAVISDTSAWIGGEVNPRNTATTYYIEYSSDPGFADSVSAPATQDADAGSGNQRVFVNHHAQGLQPDTTYYYRVVASGAGVTVGDTEIVRTRPSPFSSETGLPSGRVYERVSPVKKNGGGVSPGNPFGALAQAAAQGDSVAYASQNVNFGGNSHPIYSEYLARRGPDGWQSTGINARMEPFPSLPNSSFVHWLSGDLSTSLLLTPAALNGGDLEETINLYVGNTADGTYRTVTDPAGTLGNIYSAEAISADGRHIVYHDESGLWEWSDGVYREVGVLPDGSSVPAAGTSYAPGAYVPGENVISEDGSRVFFRFTPSDGELYVRQFDGGSAKTTLVSASERTGDDPDEAQNGFFELASPDGSVAFFSGSATGSSFSSLAPLTDESPSYGFNSLYRWDSTAPEGERLTDIALGDPDSAPNVFGTAGASEDATTVYFAAQGNLTPEATQGMANLYVWKEGEGVEFIASLRDETGTSGALDPSVWADRGDGGEVFSTGNFRQARVTPDGRYLAFASREALTAFDTRGFRQIYLYDSQTERLTCVSCSVVQDHARGSSLLTTYAQSTEAFPAGFSGASNLFGYLPRNLSADGSRIFFDSEDALVAEDTNGTTDVYEWKSGELRLLSTGDSGDRSQFHDASIDGTDAFFTTSQRLVSSDIDLSRDLYDARVNGAAEPAVRAPCIGDECQGAPTAPENFAAPSSAGFQGKGNVQQSSRSRSTKCGRAKVRRKGRCVKRRGAGKAQNVNRKKGRNH